MEQDDLCPYCLRPSCAGDAIACPARFDLVAAPLMVAQTLAEVRAAGFVDGRAGGAWLDPDGRPIVLPTLDRAVVVNVTVTGRQAGPFEGPSTPVETCVFCYGAGGFGVPCHGCKLVGPVNARERT